MHVPFWFRFKCGRNPLPSLSPLTQIAGEDQPSIVKSIEFLTDLWRMAVPVVDDATDMLLLMSTADSPNSFWWICLIALVVADIERLWLISTLCLTIVLLPFSSWLLDLAELGAESVHLGADRRLSNPRARSLHFYGRSASRLFARLNCRGDAPQNTFCGRLLDSFVWVLAGSRSRCSPLLWRLVGVGLDAAVEEADHMLVSFGAIDRWVARHPFSILGKALFGQRFKLKQGNKCASRRALVMVRAVGETLLVDVYSWPFP